MDLIWRHGAISAADVQAGLPEAPSYSAVRALLAILVEKGHLETVADGRRYLYRPTASRERVQQQALGRVLSTFFNGSAESLLSTLLNREETKLSKDQLSRLRQLLDDQEDKR